jgi:hypothetical protein
MGDSFYDLLNSASIDLVAIIALAVAIISLGFAIYYSRVTFRLTKEHYKKTVEPIIKEIYKLDSVKGRPENLFCSYQLRNSGYGPAIIKSGNFKVEGKDYNWMSKIYSDYIDDPLTTLTDDSTATVLDYDINPVALAPNETVTIFNLIFKDDNHFLKFQELAKKLSFYLNYESIYGTKRYLKRDNFAVSVINFKKPQ